MPKKKKKPVKKKKKNNKKDIDGYLIENGKIKILYKKPRGLSI